MHRTKSFILFILLLLPLAGAEAKKSSQPLTEEARQQFIYYYYEALRLYDQGDYQMAFQLIDFCYMLQPEDAMVNQYMGDLFSGLRKPFLALPYYERSYRNDPENEAILIRLEQTYIYTGQTKKALRIRDRIDKRDGYDIYSAISRYRIYAAADDSKHALQAIDEYLRFDPDNLQFLLLRMQVLEVTKTSPKKMMAAYEDVLRLDPNNALVLNNYAYFLATHKGDLKLAEQMSSYAMHADPNNPTYIDTYAWILYLRGETLLSQMYIRQAVHSYGDETIPDEVLLHYQTIMQVKK